MRQANFLAAAATNSLEKEEGKLSWISLAIYVVTCVSCFGVCLFCGLCVELNISLYVTCVLCISYINSCVLFFCIPLSMLHMGFMLDACSSLNSALHRDSSYS